jgi:hypothetical protein
MKNKNSNKKSKGMNLNSISFIVDKDAESNIIFSGFARPKGLQGFFLFSFSNPGIHGVTGYQRVSFIFPADNSNISFQPVTSLFSKNHYGGFF